MLTSRVRSLGLILFACLELNSYTATAKIAIGPKPDQVPDLLMQLKDVDPVIRSGAASLLGQIYSQNPNSKGAVSLSFDDIRLPDSKAQESATAVLKANEAEVVNALINALHDRDSDVVVFSAQALGDIGSAASSAAPELINLLHKVNHRSRSTVAIALAKTGNVVAQAVKAMTNNLKNNNPWVRQEAAYALGFMGVAAESAIPELRKLLKDKLMAAQESACRTLRYIGTAEAKVALRDYPQSCDSQPGVSITISDEQTISLLIEDLNLPSEMARISAIESLGTRRQSAQSAVPALKDLLDDPSLNIQRQACHSLKLIGTIEASDATKGYTGNCSSSVYHQF
jgi:HEAT repeat protein